MKTKRIVLAVTGASGAPYAFCLARELGGRDDVELHMVVSSAARKVMELEAEFGPDDMETLADAVHGENDIAAPPASGTWRHDGMIVCPCSMATLAAIATGVGSSLIHRAADVALKEGLPLVLVPRETPLSTIHLTNMLAAKQAGAAIVPAMPGFYHRPAGIDDLVAQLAGKILDQLGIEHNLAPRWGE